MAKEYKQKSYSYYDGTELEYNTLKGCRRYIDSLTSLISIEVNNYKSVCLSMLMEQIEPIELVAKTLAEHPDDMEKLDRLRLKFNEFVRDVKEHKEAASF